VDKKIDGIWVRNRRHALGLTQRELAYRLGVHVVTVTRWERGARDISLPGVLSAAMDAIEAGMKRDED